MFAIAPLLVLPEELAILRASANHPMSNETYVIRSEIVLVSDETVARSPAIAVARFARDSV